MTTQADSKAYTETEYKRLYGNLKKEHNILKTKFTMIKNENLILHNKLYSEAKIELPFSYQRIKDAVNTYFMVDIDIKVRLRNYVKARVIYYQIMRSTTQLTYKAIAKTLVLNHDHASIIHCLQNHQDWYEFDKVYKKDYDTILSQLQDETRETNND